MSLFRQTGIIEVDGIFLGAAVQHATGYKFVPVMPQLIRLNGMVSPTLQDTRRLAVHALRTLTQQGPSVKSARPD